MGEKETAAMSTADPAGAAQRESPSRPSSGRESPTLASSGAREAGSGMATGRVAAADVDGDGVADFRDDDTDGDRVAAHEAAHVVQQREASSGRVAATDPDGGPAEAIGFGLRISGD